jgi:hypothetical protein
MKTDFAYSIGGLQPDVIVQLRKRTEEAMPLLKGDYEDRLVDDECVYVRRASPRVWWDRLPADRCAP